ncbi:MAG: 5-(carboxyamino)imidazole ribonucleotide synthase, partial [Thermodesulfobacteriota bacterium]
IEGLKYLESKGIEVRPAPDILEIIKDKGKQKMFYEDNNLPTSDFIICNDKDEVLKKFNEGVIKLPFVQKLCRGGYDGRGVLVVDSEKKLSDLLEDQSLIEEFIDINKELSVIVAQNKLGEVKCFSPVEMVFNYDANLVDYLISPADISVDLSRESQDLAVETVKTFGLYGILSVEMFLTSDNKLLINEVAPRPHNSGHHTIESCITSQYEQHLRAVFDLPLGNTDIKTPSVMLNILGSQGYEGSAVYNGLNECLKVEGASIHIYGKKMTKPFRKMGHVTILDKSIKNALEKANFIKQNLKVVA